ncbi:MAG: hypothetical protein ABJF10_24105 [Chthoniobacter sp.]|uniref:hypothetical protein n=1 Tax=Chthoniobacter sp. TaxID=2510640 RepID=UPI0032AC4545
MWRFRVVRQVIAAGLVAVFCAAFALVAVRANETPDSFPAANADGATYYLTERISVTRSDGIQSVMTGTKVTFVRTVKDGMKVKLADGMELAVAARQVTQDSAVAQRLADQEQAQADTGAAEARARAEARAAEETARREKEMATAIDYVRQAQGATPIAPATPRPWGLTGSALDEKPRVVATIRRPAKKK